MNLKEAHLSVQVLFTVLLLVLILSVNSFGMKPLAKRLCILAHEDDESAEPISQSDDQQSIVRSLQKAFNETGLPNVLQAMVGDYYADDDPITTIDLFSPDLLPHVIRNGSPDQPHSIISVALDHEGYLTLLLPDNSHLVVKFPDGIFVRKEPGDPANNDQLGLREGSFFVAPSLMTDTVSQGLYTARIVDKRNVKAKAAALDDDNYNRWGEIWYDGEDALWCSQDNQPRTKVEIGLRLAHILALDTLIKKKIIK